MGALLSEAGGAYWPLAKGRGGGHKGWVTMPVGLSRCVGGLWKTGSKGKPLFLEAKKGGGGGGGEPDVPKTLLPQQGTSKKGRAGGRPWVPGVRTGDPRHGLGGPFTRKKFCRT